MNSNEVIDMIVQKFIHVGNPAYIPLLRGNRSFEASLCDGGINVDNLGSEPFLPWKVFTETESFLEANGGHARRSNAIMYKLGEPELSLDTVEGHIAYTIYPKQIGESVFRRITPIACILIWAGICIHEPGELKLKRW